MYTVKYLPGESDSGMFGGNSNWRGPIWFPTNFLLVESLQRFFLYYGADFKVECPVGSGDYLNLAQVAEELEHRLIHVFMPDSNGIRASYSGDSEDMLSNDEHFKGCIPFFEYFDGDTGRGLGASHQCGWTALVAKWIHDTGISCVRLPRTPRSSVTADDIQSGSSGSADGAPLIMPGRMSRRKSAKSLISLTATHLELSEEERLSHRMACPAKSLTPKTSNSEAPSGSFISGDSQEESASIEDLKYEERNQEKSEIAHEKESKLIRKLKDKLKNFSVNKDAASRTDDDELETK